MISRNPLRRPIGALALPMAAGSLCLSAPAAAETETGVDLATSGAVATNPFLLPNGDTAASINAQVSPWMRIRGAQSLLELRGTADIDQYTSNYGTDLSATVAANGRKQLSQHVILRGDAAFVTTRRTLRELAFANGNAEDPPLPTVPLPDVTFAGTNTRSERYSANVALNVIPSERGALTFAAGVNAVRFDRFPESEYDSYSASVGYAHRLTEDTSITANVGVSRSDYLRSRIGDGTIVTPQVGITHKFTDRLRASASAGVAFTRARGSNGSIQNFTAISGDVEVCNTEPLSSFCVRASRYTQATAFGGISVGTSVAFTYDRRLSERTSISATARYSRTSQSALQSGRRFEVYGASASVSRRLTQRLSGFISPGYSKYKDRVTPREANYELTAGLRFKIGAGT